jgi:hypothetical protein
VAGGHFVQLRRDAHAVAALAHAALDQIGDAELLGDLPRRHRSVLVGERGVARDYQEPAQPRERRDDVLADAVGKVFLLRLVAHVQEGKHRDGGPFGLRQAHPLLRAARRQRGDLRRRGAVGADANGADETDAPARGGADQPLRFAAVADRLARGVDAAREGRIRHDSPAPDRRDEIVLADQAVAVLHQVGQQIEHLRLKRDLLAAAMELAPAGVEDMIGEEKLHLHPFASRLQN